MGRVIVVPEYIKGYYLQLTPGAFNIAFEIISDDNN